nr:hypothetical protein [Tanacetum cinerariifolium]
MAEDVPEKEPRFDDEEADVQRALKERLKSMYDVPRGPLPPVVIREPESGKYQPLPEVPRKGKEKVTGEQVSRDLLTLQMPKKKSPADQYIFQRRTSTPTRSSGHDESLSLYAELGLTDNEEESKEDVSGADAGGQGKGQAGPDPGAQDEGQARSNRDEQAKGQAGPDPGNAEASQPMPSPVVHVRSDREHMDLDVADVSSQPPPEQMDEGFTATAYLKVQENLKLTVKEQLILEEPASSSGTLSSLQHLTKDLSFGDLFFSDNPSEANNDKATAKTIAESMVKSDSIEQEVEAELYEALEKSMNRDHSEELVKDMAEARKKKKKSRESPKTPHGSPPHQPPPPPLLAGQSKGSAAPSSSKTAASAEYQAWTTTNIRLRRSISVTPADLYMDDDMAPDEQAQSSDDEDIRNAHIPKVNLRQDWWKPLEEERPATPEPSWSIPSSDVPVPTNNWASALASNYSPPSEDSLLVQAGDIAMFMDWFCSRPALSTSKMKAAYYPDAGLEQMVPDQMWIEEECKDDITSMYNISHWWFQRQRFYIDRHTSEGDRRAVRTHTRILSVVRIEVFSMYKYDYMKKIVLHRADLNEHVITERDFKYEVQMIMRFNKIHKFSDGTLQQIDEALDYQVNEFKINRMNLGLNTRFWTRKYVDRSKEFMFAIQKWLKTRRIFRNLESFVGGRVRDGDYRLLKRIE